MKVVFAKPSLPEKGVVVVGILGGRKLTASATALDKSLKGALTRAVKASTFKGTKGQTLTLLAPGDGKISRILAVGLGKPKEINDLGLQSAGGAIYAALNRVGATTISVLVDDIDGCSFKAAEQAAEMAFGSRLRSYRFDKYRTKEKKENKPVLKTIQIQCAGNTRAKTLYQAKDKVADGVFFTRDLVSEPANVLYPVTLAKQAQTLSKLGIKVEVLNEAQMAKLGMGALLGVGQGSIRESRLVVMQWNGADKPAKGKKAEAPIAFVGKGVTFDTGGISIKPSGGMEDMKWDMGGSGVVIGLMKALAGRKAKVNAVGVVGLVENMPGGNAQRPGDIVTSMSGQTIEVLNTDAEGRLVLADALWYTKERFKPKFMVNLATLTGAIIVCLGGEMAGLFSNNDRLSERLTEAGKKVDENLWRMPLGDAYDKMINSDAADMKNIGAGRGAGSTTAAQFLQRFVDKTPWAHLDIAGVTWSKAEKPTVPKGGTGFGVRLLDRLVADYYEKK
ncbi:MAG: leucyl aminopeptidase [Rhodospirillaceae bacterium]|nr:leucyl aminopeptidase [Rhodospirillaceae bacterium]